MSWVLPLIVGIIGFLATIGVILSSIFILRKGRTIDIEPNAPLINTVVKKDFTEGHALCVVKLMRQNRNKTHFFQVYPYDKKQGVGKFFPNLYQFVVSDEMIKHYARGEYSDYREYIKILPRTNSDLPKKERADEKDIEAIQDSKEGQVAYLMKHLKLSIIANGDQAIEELLRNYSRAGIAKTAIRQLQETSAQFNKMQKLPETKEGEEKK